MDDLFRRLAAARAAGLREQALLDRAIRDASPAGRRRRASRALIIASAVALLAGGAVGVRSTSEALGGPAFTELILHKERMYSQHYETEYCAKELVTLRSGEATCTVR